jgi:hypothetical protein
MPLSQPYMLGFIFKVTGWRVNHALQSKHAEETLILYCLFCSCDWWKAAFAISNILKTDVLSIVALLKILNSWFPCHLFIDHEHIKGKQSRDKSSTRKQLPPFNPLCARRVCHPSSRIDLDLSTAQMRRIHNEPSTGTLAGHVSAPVTICCWLMRNFRVPLLSYPLQEFTNLFFVFFFSL